jgi:hypothetical protein
MSLEPDRAARPHSERLSLRFQGRALGTPYAGWARAKGSRISDASAGEECVMKCEHDHQDPAGNERGSVRARGVG